MSTSTEAGTGAAGWTVTQAYVMAVICLLVGIAVGYLLRGSAATEGPANVQTTQPQGGMAVPGTAQLTPEQLKQMADKQAEPLLRQLQANPNDAALLGSIGNLYYDAQQFREAVSYYDRALKIQPSNTDVRTDLGTAYWYLGESDKAIAEFQTALKTQPTKANALFNLGVVQWQGKMDAKAAAATWQKLLESNPNYEGKEKVQQMLAQVKQHLNVKPGTKTEKPAM